MNRQRRLCWTLWSHPGIDPLLGGRGTLWGPVLGALGLVVLFLPRGLLPTVSGWKNQGQRQNRQQADLERTPTSPIGSISLEPEKPGRPTDTVSTGGAAVDLFIGDARKRGAQAR